MTTRSVRCFTPRKLALAVDTTDTDRNIAPETC